jgi:pimeloyl-ACP methyl ester carboxylesterase
MTPLDAWERIRAGANLVQLYTGMIYEGPGLVRRINKSILRFLHRDGFKTIAEAVGSENSYPMLTIARFLNSYFRHPLARIEFEEVSLEVSGEEVPASYVRPRSRTALPGWIVLHGITVTGRQHPVLLRFVHSLAATGAAVLIPEVPSWRNLVLDTAAGDATVTAATKYLRSRSDVRTPLSLVGFSFGATQALMSSTLPAVRESLRSVVAFGGYAELRKALTFMMTGVHEDEGKGRRVVPDPYGRWVAVANNIQDIPQYAHMSELAGAAKALASEAGKLGVFAGDPSYDRMKSELGATLAPDEREIWDIIAPPTAVQPSIEAGRELAGLIADAALRKNPGLDPRQRLRNVDCKVVLAHGLDDRLIPYTETLRLRSWLPPQTRATVSITRLFAHSRGAGRLGYMHYPREFARYFTLLNRALRPGQGGD